MLKSLFTAVSGLRAQNLAMGIIGNNIANVNTIGFKGDRFSFADLMSASLAGSTGIQVGSGVMMSNVLPIFTQGSIVTTGNPLDLAIDGNGFFVVSNGNNNFYTRAGQFIINEDGDLITPEGYALQGWGVNENGQIIESMGNINLANITCPPKATESVELKLNLDAREESKTWNFSEGDSPPDPDTYNYSTTITIYDSLGNGHSVTVYFVKTGDNAWTAHYIYKDADGNYKEAGSQDLSFNDGSEEGKPAGSLADDNDDTPISFDFGGGVPAVEVTFDYGTGTDEDPPGTGLDGTTQYAEDSAVNFISQDGNAAGSLENISIDEDGYVVGIFSNGETKRLYRIALATFTNPWNLEKVGNNLYAVTGSSGQPLIGAPNTGEKGKILSGSLEQSNVDLATEFTNMILTQRAFQANARVITASDEILTELINLKR